MTKSHCDRCDTTLTGVDGALPRKWVQEFETEQSPVYHLRVVRSRKDEEYDLCKTCLRVILQLYVTANA